MKLSPLQMQKLVEKIFDHLKKSNVIEFKVDEKVAFNRALAVLKADYDRETALEKEVEAMLVQLEKSNPGEFQRHKMYGMLKQKLAKDRKVIL